MKPRYAPHITLFSVLGTILVLSSGHFFKKLICPRVMRFVHCNRHFLWQTWLKCPRSVDVDTEMFLFSFNFKGFRAPICYDVGSFVTNNRYRDATVWIKLDSRYSQQCSFIFCLIWFKLTRNKPDRVIFNMYYLEHNGVTCGWVSCCRAQVPILWC